MNTFQIFYSIVVSFIALFLVIGLTRKRNLRVNYSILWITVSIILLFGIIKYDWMIRLSAVLNLGDPKNLFFFVTIFFLISICVQFSIIISLLVLRVKNLAQKIALMESDQAKERDKRISKYQYSAHETHEIQ
jgi:hypothetical protein